MLLIQYLFQRETSLRDEIRALREVTQNASESVIESTQHYQVIDNEQVWLDYY